MFDPDELREAGRQRRSWPANRRSATGAPELQGLSIEARRRRYRALVRSDRWSPEAVALHFGVEVDEVRAALVEA